MGFCNYLPASTTVSVAIKLVLGANLLLKKWPKKGFDEPVFGPIRLKVLRQASRQMFSWLPTQPGQRYWTLLTLVFRCFFEALDIQELWRIFVNFGFQMMVIKKGIGNWICQSINKPIKHQMTWFCLINSSWLHCMALGVRLSFKGLLLMSFRNWRNQFNTGSRRLESFQIFPSSGFGICDFLGNLNVVSSKCHLFLLSSAAILLCWPQDHPYLCWTSPVGDRRGNLYVRVRCA